MEKLAEKQLASLEIVAKTAASRASEALSKLINAPVKLQVIQIRSVKVEHLASTLTSPEEQVVAAILPVTGESIGSSAFISSLPESLRFAELLTKRPKGSLTKLDDDASSALKECANIVGGAFLSELSNTTGISLIQSVPELLIDTIKKVINAEIAKLRQKDSKLSVAFEINFALSTTTTTTEVIMSHYIFLLKVAFAQKLLAALAKQAS